MLLRLFGRLLCPDSGSYTYLQDLDWTEVCLVVIRIQYDQYVSLVHYIGFLSIFLSSGQVQKRLWLGVLVSATCVP